MYFLPEDGKDLREALFNILSDPDVTEIWIKAFGFNMDSLLSKLLELDSNGTKIHILADYMQARGPGSWKKLVDFHSKLKNRDLTLTTAGAGSDQPSIIFHTKALTAIRKNKNALNFCGSCNFSDTGFSQANNVRVFESQTWSDNFVEHFKVHQAWALDKAKNKQINYILANPVQAEGLEMSEDFADYIFDMDNLKTQNTKLKKVAIILAVWTSLEFLWIIAQWLIIRPPIGR